MLNQPIHFHPDISQKYEQFCQHTTSKHKVLNEFLSILKSLCDLEEFYSRNLEKLADSVSKLMLGKDTLKEVFIVFERMLSAKSDEAKLLAENVKNDMMPFTKQIASEGNYSFKGDGGLVKEVRSEMQKKHRSLQQHRRLYLKAYNELTQHSSTSPPAVKQQLRSKLSTQQQSLTQFLGSYNSCVDNYILCLSDLTNKFTNSERERKRSLKSAIQKYMIFEMSAIKNLEYNIDRYCKTMDAMDDKVAINQRVAEVEEGTVALAKVSPNNYMEYLKSDALENGKSKIMPVRAMRELYHGEIDQNKYKQVLRESYSLLDHLQQTKDIGNLKKLIQYGTQVHKILPQHDGTITRMSLSEGMYCHDIFKDVAFWQTYTDSVLNMLERETGSMSSLEYQVQEELEEEIRFVRSIRLDGLISSEFFRRVEKEMAKHIRTDGVVGRLQTEQPKQTQHTQQTQQTQQNQQNVASQAVRRQAQQPVSEGDPGPMYTAQQYDAFS